MNYALLLRMSLVRLGRYKVRTVMMGMGIIVSVLTTIVIQTASAGFRQAFDTFIGRAYPADAIWVIAGSGAMGGGAGRSNLHLADIDTIRGAIPDIVDWDPLIGIGGRDVKNAAAATNVEVFGTSERAELVRHRGVSKGDFMSADDVKTRAHVALLGSTTARQLFPAGDALGSQIYIDNMAFTVKGILESVGVDPHGGDQDHAIHVPYTTMMDQMAHKDYIAAATFVVKDRQRIPAITEQIADVLRERHGISKGQVDDFGIINPVMMQAMVDKSFKIMTIFVPLIAATAFLISGLVILSIMLISIKERTAEIGLRKAIGARPRDLEIQILFEVSVISLIASVIGVGLAEVAAEIIAPTLAANFGVKHLAITSMTLAIGVSTAVATGLIGAVLPARRAAKLNPVLALK